MLFERKEKKRLKLWKVGTWSMPVTLINDDTYINENCESISLL